ncbi:MAG TPA: YiiX/YebB-like N1pC/P60 family cysteine hydrolase [Burkholderiales bacterium]
MNESDSATLREVFEGFERLEAMYRRAWQMMSPGSRGYFTPDEDNEIRHMLLAYRNYRLACWDVIWRNYLEYRRNRGSAAGLRAFVLGYAAALRLYQKSLRLIEIAEFDPMLRAKLNEPDRKFGLDGGFFEEVLVSYSSLYNYLRLVAASADWRLNRRRVRALGIEDDPDIGWLVPVIARERRGLKGRFWFILGKRLRRDWRAALRNLLKPVSLLRYQSRAQLATFVANLRIGVQYVHGIGPRALEHLRGVLRPGDVLLVRAEDKITSALLPGFWAHAAIYAGDMDALERLGLLEEPRLARLRPILERQVAPRGFVLEAVSQGCRVHSLEHCLTADHVAVLRPALDGAALRDSLLEAFAHVGKPYDFEFDFNVTTRIVCTELVYRSLHGRGAIRFELTRRLGRYTLTADDMVEQLLAGAQRGEPPFTVEALLLREGRGEAQPVPAAERLARLRGRAPAASAPAAQATHPLPAQPAAPGSTPRAP